MTLKRNFSAILVHPIEDKPFKQDVRYKLNPDGRTIAVNQETGQPIEVDPGKDITLGDLAIEAIGAVLQTQEPMPGADILKLLDLAQRIKHAPNGVVEFTDEADITLLKERINKLHKGNVFLVGTAFKLLTTDWVAPGVVNAGQPADTVVVNAPPPAPPEPSTKSKRK